MKRHAMSRRSSKKNFSRNASMTHVKNIRSKPMRGGIRL